MCRTAGTETVTETETGVVQFTLSSRCDATMCEISTSVNSKQNVHELSKKEEEEEEEDDDDDDDNDD